MTGSILRIASLMLLAAVTTVSTSRIVCWLPCAAGDVSGHWETVEGGSHCGRETADVGSRLIASGTTCDDCDQLRLADADRLASRNSLLNDVITLARAIEDRAPASSAEWLHRLVEKAPDRRFAAPLPLPLRI